MALVVSVVMVAWEALAVNERFYSLLRKNPASFGAGFYVFIPGLLAEIWGKKPRTGVFWTFFLVVNFEFTISYGAELRTGPIFMAYGMINQSNKEQ
ncbi:MAG: hypothetical protein IK012_11635 [Fibrobacter sp.]|uniref:hypothetical protein n=1 Tax=Fibrobacter sp. TaxID=35828 RepID=UPI0025C5F945|nr:hypothetical protein [Fibrobacter sp.]MBR4785882.1 hypothetical protein [Fibrobacter sp.]